MTDTLRDLRRAVAFLPAGATVSLPVGVLRQLLGPEPVVEGDLTAAAAARLLHRPSSTVVTWTKSQNGKPPKLAGAYRRGGHLWIPAAAVEALLPGQHRSDDEPR